MNINNLEDNLRDLLIAQLTVVEELFHSCNNGLEAEVPSVFVNELMRLGNA
jgi:hypothetical protein